MQNIVELRSPVEQGGGDRAQGQAREVPCHFVPLTEDDLIVSYSLSYRHDPDVIFETIYKGKNLIINKYNEISNNRIYTHSIEQRGKRDNNEFESWYKVSLFGTEGIDIDKVKNNMDRALIFSRIFRTQGSRAHKDMTRQRTTNLFGRRLSRILQH
ncbi:unnamed protein product [Macrosiphum euphorbiae]|uniref:Uncharacterized protein n=1 Tax=Macrosiphum euphorbiae TaxID=13131 RepID=A0AAV0WRA3_9HEMI|nr:unnamed protein product [Macrosiphum euphorbiae]